MIKRMNKFMYCRARNHRVNFGTILDEAMRMVQGLDEQKRRDDYLGDLKVGGWVRCVQVPASLASRRPTPDFHRPTPTQIQSPPPPGALRVGAGGARGGRV